MSRLVAVILLAVFALGGCQSLGAQGRGGGDSLFSLVSPPTPAEAARWAVDPNSPDNRQQGLLLLANAPFGSESVYMELYRLALEDEDAAVRAAGVRAIGLNGGPPEAELVVPMLSPEEDVLVRREAARTLSRIHLPEAAPALVAATNADREPDPEVRALACDALGQYREMRVVQGLIGALTDTRLLVGASARRSLETLTGMDLGPEPEPWLEWSVETTDPFRDARVYQYTVYQRDRRILEYIVPWLEPPNETPSTPAGLPLEARATSGG